MYLKHPPSLPLLPQPPLLTAYYYYGVKLMGVPMYLLTPYPVGARPTCTNVSVDPCNLSVQDPPIPMYLLTPVTCWCKTHLYQGI